MFQIQRVALNLVEYAGLSLRENFTHLACVWRLSGLLSVKSGMRYLKTDEGQAAFRERSALFTSRQRAVFILFDGVRSVGEVLAATASLGTTRLDIEHMATHGFVKEAAVSGTPAVAVAAGSKTAPAPAASTAPSPAPVLNGAPTSPRTPQERYFQGRLLATQLTASLGLRGLLLNMGVESASGYDDLKALFPKIQSALGAEKCAELERVLNG